MTRIIDGTPLELARHIIDGLIKRSDDELDEYNRSIRFSLAIAYINIAMIHRYHRALKKNAHDIQQESNIGWSPILDDISNLTLDQHRSINARLDKEPSFYREIKRFDDVSRSNELVFTDDSMPISEPIFSSKDQKIFSVILSLALRFLGYFASPDDRLRDVAESLRKSDSPILKVISRSISFKDLRVLSPFVYSMTKLFFTWIFRRRILSRKKFFQFAYVRQAMYPVFLREHLALGSHGGQEDSSTWSNANIFASCAGIPWCKFNLSRVPSNASGLCLLQNEVSVIMYAHDGYDVRMRSGMESWQLKEYHDDIRDLIGLLESSGQTVNLCLHPKDSGGWISETMKLRVNIVKFEKAQRSAIKIATYPSTVLLKRKHSPGEQWLYFFRLDHWPRNWASSDLRTFKRSLYAETLIELSRLLESPPPFSNELHLRFCGVVDQ